MMYSQRVLIKLNSLKCGVHSRRTLFKNPKKVQKGIISEDASTESYHEYSIRPDTFSFKVDALRNRIGEKHEDTPDKIHPLQDSSQKRKNNLIDLIYRNATNYPFKNRSPDSIYQQYPMINSKKLGRRFHVPKKVKMRTSDFIEDSLYNPNYGYFSKEVEIFKPDQPFDYSNIKDVDEFLENWEKAYLKYDDKKTPVELSKSPMLVDENSYKTPQSSRMGTKAVQLLKQEHEVEKSQRIKKKRHLQLWHTPTELFSPHYGEAIARYILVNYKLNGNFPYQDLVIYEMGGGNGTLMCDILKYIKQTQPEIYSKTRYKIIEISSQLAEKQALNALSAKLSEKGLDDGKLEIINKSIFDWDVVVNEACYFIALEVFDNFAHDLIRYDNVTGIPYEGRVLIDGMGDFYEFFSPELSYYSSTFLNLRENGPLSKLKETEGLNAKIELLRSIIPFFTNRDHIHPLNHSQTMLKLKNYFIPMKDNLSPGEFIPTRLLQFFHILKHKFPHHTLIASDFHYLPNTIPGYYNAPVVQTVLQNKMVDITTYMCLQGYFDILFPTDFNLASFLYKQVTGKISKVESHRDFLETWADVDATTTKKGDNPMLDFYTNVSFLVS